jgi:hypothetical protein
MKDNLKIKREERRREAKLRIAKRLGRARAVTLSFIVKVRYSLTKAAQNVVLL